MICVPLAFNPVIKQIKIIAFSVFCSKVKLTGTKNFSVLIIKSLHGGRADLVLFVFKLIIGYQEYTR